MTEHFPALSKAVHQRFVALSKHELFEVDVLDPQASYLAAFPEGTNPIYRVNTEHHCSCCFNFIRNLGKVVAIVDGKKLSVWQCEGLPAPYDVVAQAMDDLVQQAPISGVYRTKEGAYGADHTYEIPKDENGQPIKSDKAEGYKRWFHLHGSVARRHHADKPDEVCGTINTTAQVLRRGLDELKPEALETVLGLIDAKTLYKGDEFRRGVQAFASLQRDYLQAKNPDLYVWANVDSPAARFRGTVIGTLVQDLSEGVDLERAVRSYEVKTAPANYKRPTALITPKMVEAAMLTLANLGLETAVERRFARIEDVSVNDVLFVDNATQGRMKGGLRSALLEVAKDKPAEAKDATRISMADFMAKVVPTAKRIEVLFKNTQRSNLVSLTAPVHADAGRLFRWDNGFAWSYNGELADSDLRQRVQAAGGRVDGALRFSFSWNHDGQNQSLMDLHVFMPGAPDRYHGNRNALVNDSYPSTRRVGWNHRQDHASGGVQDVDNVDMPGKRIPVENITFPHMHLLPEGKYVFKIHNWRARSPNTSGFHAEIELAGQVYQYEYRKATSNKEWVTVAEATLKNGVFTIEHFLPHGEASLEAWGLKTQTFVPVTTLMTSPNHWEGAGGVGHKHWFFMLQGARNPDPARGIYNEYLLPDLDQHRKVFEVIGSKTKCVPTDDQISGLGFSSTRNDEVTVRVTTPSSVRAYNIAF